MLKSTVPSLGNPGTFDITDKTDPLYYIARAAHEQSLVFYNLNQAGFEFRQMQQSDIQGVETAYDTWLASIATWLDTAVQDSMDGDPITAVPTPPDLFPTYETSDASGIWWAIIKICIYYILLKLRKDLDSGTETGELAQILKQGLIGSAGGTEYSFIELLQNTPLEIIINKHDDYQDINYEVP